MNPSADTTFQHPHGTLQLRRWPRLAQDPLRAWDGADRYLLEVLAEEGSDAPLLVLNDQCGALTLAQRQAGREVLGSGDSWLAHAALRANAADNDLAIDDLRWAWADQPLPEGAQQALVRLPKELSLLAWQLAGLTQVLPAGAPVWLAGMDKHLPDQLGQVLASWLDHAHAGLGRHKARVFRGRIPATPKPLPSPAVLALPEYGWTLHNGAGVFARQQLDIGARFLLDHIPDDVCGDICDLGCGNGVIGMMALKRNPQARLWCCDESALALASARDNLQRAFPEREVSFHLGNGLDGLSQQFDLILLNPPFHRGHALDDTVARTLFRHARRHLRPGGRLRVIGNSHLNYGSVLRRQFARVQQVARNNKFTILDADV